MNIKLINKRISSGGTLSFCSHFMANVGIFFNTAKDFYEFSIENVKL